MTLSKSPHLCFMTNGPDMDTLLSVFVGRMSVSGIVQKTIFWSGLWVHTAPYELICILTGLPWFWFCCWSQYCFCCFGRCIRLPSHMRCFIMTRASLCGSLLLKHISDFPKELFFTAEELSFPTSYRQQAESTWACCSRLQIFLVIWATELQLPQNNFIHVLGFENFWAFFS